MAGELVAGPGVARWVLGRSLRSLRMGAGLTTRVAAGLLEWSEPKLWRVETGQTGLRGLDVAAMCRAYGAPPGPAAALEALAREVRQAQPGGWWRPRGEDVAGGFGVYGALEEEACLLAGYACGQVPGLLRTGDYARALIGARRPGITPDEAGRLAGRCLARQVAVTRAAAPLEISVILSEALLHAPVGGLGVMAGQLRHLAAITALPNVGVRVVPFSAGLHPGMLAGPFTVLRFTRRERGGAPDTVCRATLAGELYLDQPAQVRRYHEAHAATLACCLGQAESRDLLLSVAKDMGR
jgi:Domain of unknown function (DUF5753)/Helix-turn-helix domain